MTLTHEALETLRKRLPRGYQSTLVRQFDGRYSQSYISRVAHGTLSNEEVLVALVELAEEHERKQAELEARARGEQTRA